MNLSSSSGLLFLHKKFRTKVLRFDCSSLYEFVYFTIFIFPEEMEGYTSFVKKLIVLNVWCVQRISNRYDLNWTIDYCSKFCLEINQNYIGACNDKGRSEFQISNFQMLVFNYLILHFSLLTVLQLSIQSSIKKQ